MSQGHRPDIGPIVDCNVHLWDQHENPVFWLSDRTLVRGMLGNYDSLPDRYTLPDYRRETMGHDVRGVIWSDAGAADPMAAADWVSRQPQDGMPAVLAIVTLGDPASAAFAGLVEHCRQRPLIRSVRVRLVAGLSGPAAGGDFLDDRLVRDNLALLASSDLVATVEATSSQLEVVTRLAAQFPSLRIVVDHFGWPEVGPGGGDLAGHVRRLAAWPQPVTSRPGSTPSAPSSVAGPFPGYARGCWRWPVCSARSGACSAQTCRSRTCGQASGRCTPPMT